MIDLLKNTYILGPRSDENSQWNMMMDLLAASVVLIGASTKLSIMLSRVYKFLAPYKMST